ncbi:hypothetical protein EDB85DRAFT_1189429 [Lactarius pseudohatsudake]|nr:hypothetical protein EDB85DRAFT_1189429 [Lactarius pseudohatsudake]
MVGWPSLRSSPCPILRSPEMDSHSAHVNIDVQTPPTSTFPPGVQPPDPGTQVRPTTTTNNRGDAFAPLPDTNPQRGENYGDSSGRLWMLYLTEAEKEDKEITENWKGDTEGILVFTGLFSATVATFIIESYKQLSLDSGVTTNALLTQISQQLADTSNGTPFAGVGAQNSLPFKPTASAVRVNVMWFLSLVLSLTCALSATLMQQWARRYQELARRRGAPHKRARMRAYIFDGIKGFRMTRAIEAMPMLLHLSVFLFFAGLIEFLIPINTTVAYFTLGWIALFALAYVILTILPNLYLNCPYRTPLSGITWRLSQFSVLRILLAIRGVEGLFHGSLLSLWHWTHQQVTGTPGPTKWRETLKMQVAMRRKWLSDGLRKSVELSATDAPSTVDKDALEWTLTALDEDKEIEDFAERVPGFFDSRAVPDPTSAILPLMADQSTTDPILGSRLYDLLKTCIPGTSPLTEEKRRSRLWVCLRSLWYCGEAYNRPKNSEPLPSYVRVVFASPEMTRRIQAEEDPAARVIGRCFGSLVAKKLSADIDSRNTRGVRVKEGELACLSAILGTEGHEVMSWLGEPGAIELANIVSLMLVGADPLVGDKMPSDVLDVFKKTLNILSQALLGKIHADLPLPQITQFHEIYSKAPNWLTGELRQISDKLRLPTGIVAFPEPQESSWTNISHVSQQSRENQVRTEVAPDSGIGDGLVHDT